jgi:hypothetical protein
MSATAHCERQTITKTNLINSDWRLNVYHAKYSGIARALVSEHGAGSAAVAAERAEEKIANIDLGGFAYWKRVEHCIQKQTGGAA